MFDLLSMNIISERRYLRNTGTFAHSTNEQWLFDNFPILGYTTRRKRRGCSSVGRAHQSH